MSKRMIIPAAALVVLLLAVAGISLADAGSDDPTPATGGTVVDDSSSPSATPSPSVSQTAPAVLPDGGTTYEAGGAGTVTVARDGDTLAITGTSTTDGWQSHIDEAQGREVEVDFTNGAREIDFNAELEDDQVRIRVRDEVDDDDRRGSDDDRWDADDDRRGSDDDRWDDDHDDHDDRDHHNDDDDRWDDDDRDDDDDDDDRWDD